MKAIVTMFLFLSLFGPNFSLYRKHFLVTEKMTWNDAQTHCREYYDDLSTVSKEEAQLLIINPELNGDYFWIGLHMVSNSLDQWSWSGGEDQKIDYWDSGEPNKVFEECGIVIRSKVKLHNANCSWPLPFYCMDVYEPILVQQSKTWDEAHDYCIQNYIDLVSLRSPMKMEEVIKKTITSQTVYVWTGLRFLPGNWFWAGGRDLKYKAWSAEGELQCPARNLRCGALDRITKIWQPKDCEEKLNFVCIRKP
ncbi:snaclec stejaggregin-B subunit beta-2-like [Garra rufa]|uniref:snaclec stejaggregin-B subunit beta-2-like n=1 Tax=Garra rufa TaxID=137080 RepID=UPI003CCE8589